MRNHKVLIVDDEADLRELMRKFLEGKGFETVLAANCDIAEQVCRTTRPDIAVLDYSLPDGNALELIPRLRAIDQSIPVIILTGYGSIELAVEAIKLGADQFLTKPAELSALMMLIQRSLENQRNHRKQLVEKTRMHRNALNPFIGSSEAIKRFSELCNKVTATDSPVLILGETGSGKGVLARWLHQNGPRAAEPFVDLNCGGFSRELLDTELFGHERGAFTGAVQSKTGLLDIAHKGTVFLDEIGDVDLQIQPRLLKVLEDKQFRRLGDVRDRRVDIRLVAATHQDMAKLVREKQFRSDLYFRVSTILLNAPALRERAEDLPALSTNILATLSADLGAGEFELTGPALRALQCYSWPGNIRELRNVLERAVLIKGSNVITEKDLHFDVHVESEIADNGSLKTLHEVQRQYIQQVLQHEGGRVESAARRLGIPRSSLYNKLKQYHIGRPSMGAMQ
ncbi:MAG: two component, sigma54 specific, transcriptional regulator, Fis family [Acidobacteriaceae bacterium]|nr:two component, sigma54 specific, transcriptional regulator, Fis family [Acidobacteriaceae bacterium]